jgi:hypothetical protein
MEYKTHVEIEVDIDFDFDPEEPRVLYPNDKAHPGSPASVTINSVMVAGIDIAEHLPASRLEILSAEIMESIGEEQ